MFAGSRKFVLIGLFTLVLIAGVNIVWWLGYEQAEALLEDQLTRRLTTVASYGSANLTVDWLYGVMDGEDEALIELTDYLENVRQSDSLAEVFLLDDRYYYIATTLLEPDSAYFLADLHSAIVDSLYYGESERVLVTPTYRSGDTYLKTAFAAVYEYPGQVVAVLGVEASLDYFDALGELRRDLYFSTAVSVGGGLLAGLVLILLQLRIGRAEARAFINETETYLGRMVAVVSHEIKNPLAIIRGSGERLVKKTDSEEARFIVEEADRLNRIVSGYLDFARGRHSIVTTEDRLDFSVREILDKVKARLESEFGADKIDWYHYEPGDNLQMSGYKNSLGQVIYNLLLNGAQACASRQLPVKLAVRSRSDSGEVRIELSDQGGGLSGRNLKRAFTPFFSTRPSGSGLGLYLSRRIVEEMDGQLTLENNNEGGLTALISLPQDRD